MHYATVVAVHTDRPGSLPIVALVELIPPRWRSNRPPRLERGSGLAPMADRGRVGRRECCRSRRSRESGASHHPNGVLTRTCRHRLRIRRTDASGRAHHRPPSASRRTDPRVHGMPRSHSYRSNSPKSLARRSFLPIGDAWKVVTCPIHNTTLAPHRCLNDESDAYVVL